MHRISHSLGKEVVHHLVTEAKRRSATSATKTVVLSERDVPTREIPVRFIFIKLAKKIFDRYVIEYNLFF